MGKKKILAVDDEPNILMSIEFILEMEGYEVHTARDGEEALEVAERVRPDLILLDVNMPRKDGYEMCRILREREDLATTKVIMLTAKGQTLERKKGLEVGADDYVTKPFSAGDLLEKIRAMIEP
ncbi:response regulator transcription factor [Geobacter argillaceus]|uniref:Response regulator receiver protein n=1 Tax=Geobacter argillaceus TaxID=345631 RepID=A0A562WSV4_9BACT|nr:response regulator [Geobacter argillaceus]TWJ33381.1 response regulator receiver protein [Geobacter argillaceus]